MVNPVGYETKMSVRSRNYPRGVELGPSPRQYSRFIFLVIGLVAFLLIVANLDYRTSRTPPKRAARQQRAVKRIERRNPGLNDVLTPSEAEELMQLLHDDDLNDGRRRVIRRNCD